MYVFDCRTWCCRCCCSRRGNLASSLLFVASTALVALVELNVEAKELPLSPINLTIEEIFSTAAVLKWTVVSSDPEEDAAGSGHFQLIIQRMGHPAGWTNSAGDQQVNGHSSRIIEVPELARSFLIQFLVPDTGYRVYAAAINEHGRSNLSDPVDFYTLLDGAVHLQHYQMHSAEVAIIVFILSAWLCAVGLFLHKWRRIRILPPREPRFKHNPKNLDTIKVVKRPTDSIIYKSYTKQISTTMQARQKKLERMSTMPNIKVTAEALPSPGGSRKTGRSTLFTLTENGDGIRPSASGPAAFEVFEKLLAAPSSSKILQAAAPLDGAKTGAADGEGVGGRKRMSSDSEVIRMAKELPEVGKRWTKDIAGNAGRVVQVLANWDKDSAGSAGRVSKNLMSGSSGSDVEMSLNSEDDQKTMPGYASKITLVLTNFEQDIAGSETEVTNFWRPSDSTQPAVESPDKLSDILTNWDNDVKENTGEVTQLYRNSAIDNAVKEITATQISGGWENEINEVTHLLTNCGNDTVTKSSKAGNISTRLDKDIPGKDSTVPDYCARISKDSVGLDKPSLSENGRVSVDKS